MSSSWDEKHARNKDVAKDAFDKAAEETDRGHAERMKIALDGVAEFEEHPEQEPQSLPGSALEGDDERIKFGRGEDQMSAMDVLTGMQARPLTKQGARDHGDDPKDPKNPQARDAQGPDQDRDQDREDEREDGQGEQEQDAWSNPPVLSLGAQSRSLSPERQRDLDRMAQQLQQAKNKEREIDR